MFAKTYTFSPSTTIASAEVNQNFDDCINAVNSAMPSGIIVMYNGAIASIPSGFYLCNGANGTTDMRDKFVIGAGSTYAVDATGGAATHTLTSAEIPAHTHPFQLRGDADAGAGAYNAESNDSSLSSSYTTGNNTGGGGAHNNLPPYVSKAFIMKS